MSKKLKITESQLQKLVERKHSYRDNSPEGDMEEGEMMGAESAIVKPEEGDVEESRFGMGSEESLDEIVDDLTRCHNDLSDLAGTMEQLTYAIDGNEKLASIAEAFDAAYVKVSDAYSDVDMLLTEAQNILEREEMGDDEEEEDYEDEEVMNESLKAIKANFRRFL